MSRIRIAILLAVLAFAFSSTGCLVTNGTNPPGDDDDDNSVEVIIRLLEWRLGSAGPGIADRLAVLFQSPYRDPVENFTSDSDGVITVMANQSAAHLAVEAPHGELFYLLPNLGNGAWDIAHPNYPPATATLPIHVMFEPGGGGFTGGTLFTGGGRTAAQETFSGMATAYDLDVQLRNFHGDGTVTIAALLGQGNPELRAAIQQVPNGTDVTLDQDFAPFTLAATSADPAVTVTSASLTGHVAGADIPLNSAADEAQLPIAGTSLALDVFDFYRLDIQGTAADGGGIVTEFQAGILLDPTQLDALVDPSASSVSYPLDTRPVETAATTGDDTISRSLSVKLGPTGSVEKHITTAGTGGDTPVLRLTDETELEFEGQNAVTGETWSTSPSAGSTGPVTPEVRITDVQVTGSVSAETVDAIWVIRPTGCNAMEINNSNHTVSEWYVPYYLDGDEPGCYTFWATTTVGSGGTDDSFTVQFFDSEAAVVGSTSSTLASGASWTLGSSSAFATPTSGDTHVGNVFVGQVTVDAAYDTVLADGLYVVDGAALVGASGALGVDPFAGSYVSPKTKDAHPYQFTWSD